MLEERGAATGTQQPDAIERGRAFAELTGWRVVAVRGSDARSWLHDLVTTDVDGLPESASRRSLLLTPTGRIRADFHVAAAGGSFLLLQAPDQPENVGAILRPYVLSSDVELDDRTDRSEVVAVLDGGALGDAGGGVVLSPSVLGTGHDVVLPRGDSTPLLDRLRAAGLVEMGADDLEVRRIRRGTARMGVDFASDALPAEAGLEDTIDLTKGCFLGQESVAKVRTLGHPPRVVLAVRSEAPIGTGTPVVVGDVVVGEVTSAAEAPTGVDAFVRVRWEAAHDRLATEAGPLSLRNQE